MELQQAQLELEKEKENRSFAVLADSTNTKAPVVSKIARPVSSRNLSKFRGEADASHSFSLLAHRT